MDDVLEHARMLEVAAQDAVRISGEQDAGITLLKIRDPYSLEDNREDPELPSGTGDKTVLRCRGTGVWSDGDSRTHVIVKVTIDADEDPSSTSAPSSRRSPSAVASARP